VIFVAVVVVVLVAPVFRLPKFPFTVLGIMAVMVAPVVLLTALGMAAEALAV
jgi:hypothetical protein